MAEHRVAGLPFDPIVEARRHWDDRWEEGRAMAAATSIMRAQQLVLAEVDRALRPFGLTFARYEVLVLLLFSRRGSLPMGKMGDRLMVHPTSVTSIVDRLERDGLVRRAAHPDDRRIILAELTAEGRELALRATKAVEAVRFGLGALGDRELDQLTRVVTRLRKGAGDFTG
ncbi:MAG: MarR family winged helix-turn-helix transcriptional regulator [Acidimicrobiales bacterium]